MKILIPYAGSSNIDETTQYLKSLAEVKRTTIIQRIIESIKQIPDCSFVFVVRKEEVSRFHIDNVIKLLVPDATLIVAESDTAGSACSCLLAIEALDPEEPLIIFGSDQIVAYDLNVPLASFNGYDGGVIIFRDIHPKWSYVKLDENGNVIEAAEKNPISNYATAGFYYFGKAKYFIKAAMDSIRKGSSVNGQYFVCPVLNEMVLSNMTIKTYEIPKDRYFKVGDKAGLAMYEHYIDKLGE